MYLIEVVKRRDAKIAELEKKVVNLVQQNLQLKTQSREFHVGLDDLQQHGRKDSSKSMFPKRFWPL